MTACEKCWGRAYARYRITGKSQAECYHDILKETKDNVCTPKEQAGSWWDEETQTDRRNDDSIN